MRQRDGRDDRRPVAAALLAAVLLSGAVDPARAQMSCDPCAVGVLILGVVPVLYSLFFRVRFDGFRY